MSIDHAELERLFLGLADKTRLRLLGLIANGPVSVGDLVAATGESQPKISRHLAYLRNAGLVDTTRDGKWIYYGIARLNDSSADSVFACVIDALAGRCGSNSIKTDIYGSYDPVALKRDNGWDDPSQESIDREELEIFLL